MTAPYLEQLLLNLELPTTFNQQDFVISRSNYQAISWIKQWPNWPNQVMAIHGPVGCGKTHLSYIWQRHSNATLLAAKDIDAYPIETISPGSSFCVEGAPYDETKFLHFFNCVVENKGFLLLIDQKPPAYWPVGLPDLQSRLKAVLALEIEMPDDSLLTAVLTKLFTDRQLRVSGDLIQHITTRIDRSFESAHTLVQELDSLCLQHHRAVTPALVRQVISKKI